MYIKQGMSWHHTVHTDVHTYIQNSSQLLRTIANHQIYKLATQLSFLLIIHFHLAPELIILSFASSSDTQQLDLS